MKYPIRCNQCNSAMINGFFCHEIGCPNEKKLYDSEEENWFDVCDCFQCGYEVREGEACCQDY